MTNKYLFRVATLTLAYISGFTTIPQPLLIATEEAQQDPAAPPRPTSPFKSYLSALGIVEPSSESIFIGTPVNRVVDKVYVQVGQKVKKGEILLRLEDSDLEADFNSRLVAYKIALARLKRLEGLPRPEDISAAEASLKESELGLEQARSQYERVQGLQDTRALSQEEIARRLFNYQQAEAKWLQAKANFDKIKAGTWKPDLEIAYLEAQQAKASIERVKADIERTIIRAPIDGTILQVKIHQGEFPPADTARSPIMVMGNIDEMHLKTSINQFEISNFRPDAQAVAFSQGDARIEYPLEFVRLEPYLTSKQNITNDILEKVDTRVLHVIYRFKKDAKNIFVGQQMDVYIDTSS
ncbi:HlyD family secretion protein [Candidatus Protochlamydia phocaeensis]|uniref:HlyD family secretion protein n=1 Tax=Candidatus Protochlamydia phocaeensis TaxID=1414722 RepID=UPI000B0145AE|nr:HlyD family efflux transporter periplasmic adaptor subunit [Candidatus Protochlamydia phocaeensis]